MPPGEVGALRVRGGSRALGYWQQAERTALAFRGEWYVTGDLVSRDADGYFTYAGRGDDMLKVAGKWVAPAEVEDCLLQHPAVKECAVVGITDAHGLVKPCAFVVRQGALRGGGRSDRRSPGLREGAPRPLQVPARGGLPGRAAAHAPGQGRPRPAASRRPFLDRLFTTKTQRTRRAQRTAQPGVGRVPSRKKTRGEAIPSPAPEPGAFLFESRVESPSGPFFVTFVPLWGFRS